MDLQKFAQGAQVQDGPRPSAQTGDVALAAQALSGTLATTQNLLEDGKRQREAAIELSEDASIAQGRIVNESFKRREPLAEAVQSGHLTAEQAAKFGSDEASSLEALDQASAQGLGISVRNALERSVRYQFAAMRNPGAAKELAAVYGVNDTSIETDTLNSLKKLEREQLAEDADRVRELAEAEGYTDFLGKQDEEVLEMWLGSPAAKRELEIKQSQRRALQQETSLAERAPHASRALSLSLGAVPQAINKLQLDYTRATGSNNLGGDGTSISFAQQLNLWADDQISEAARTYADFPKLLESFTSGIRTTVNARLESITKGLDIGRAEHEAQVQRPLELARLQEDLERDRFTNSQNPITAMRNVVNLNTTISKEQTRIAQLRDEVVNSTAADKAPNLARYLESGVNAQRMALISAGVAEGSNIMLNKLTNSEEGQYKENVDAAVASLQHIIRSGGVDGNQEQVKRAIRDFSIAHEYNIDMSPSKARDMSVAILQMAEDPKFVAMAQKSPAVRQLLRPYSEGIKTQVIESLNKTINKAATDRVSTLGNRRVPGSTASRFALWRKVGPNMVLDSAATDKLGVPQYRLVDNIGELLHKDDIAEHTAVIGEYNQDLRLREDSRQYELLKNLSGATSISSALEQVINSDEGVAISTLNPQRKVEDRDPEAVEKALKQAEGSGRNRTDFAQ